MIFKFLFSMNIKNIFTTSSRVFIKIIMMWFILLYCFINVFVYLVFLRLFFFSFFINFNNNRFSFFYYLFYSRSLTVVKVLLDFSFFLLFNRILILFYIFKSFIVFQFLAFFLHI